jgi:3-phenylpropionate/cinnamic acid dioxygenase small subunit
MAETDEFLEMESIVEKGMHFWEQLLFREAWLLDNNRYEDWLKLLAQGIRYYAPVQANRRKDSGPEIELCHFDDRHADLIKKVKRIRTGAARSEEFPSRVRRYISNVLVTESLDDSARVNSNFIVVRHRSGGRMNMFTGSRQDNWIKVNSDSWELNSRLIQIDGDVVNNISIFF